MLLPRASDPSYQCMLLRKSVSEGRQGVLCKDEPDCRSIYPRKMLTQTLQGKGRARLSLAPWLCQFYIILAAVTLCVLACASP